MLKKEAVVVLHVPITEELLDAVKNELQRQHKFTANKLVLKTNRFLLHLYQWDTRYKREANIEGVLHAPDRLRLSCKLVKGARIVLYMVLFFVVLIELLTLGLVFDEGLRYLPLPFFPAGIGLLSLRAIKYDLNCCLRAVVQSIEKEVRTMKYVCELCGWVYDEDESGVKWEDLPEDFACELCGVGKDQFVAE